MRSLYNPFSPMRHLHLWNVAAFGGDDSGSSGGDGGGGGGNDNQPAPVQIKSGDTLSQIAKDNNTTVAAIAKANNIKDVNKIQAGASLSMPSASAATSSSSSNNNNNNDPVRTNTIFTDISMGLGITPKNQEYVDATARTIARNGDAGHASRYASGMVNDGFSDNFNVTTQATETPTSFGDAFSAARAAQGDGGVFEFEGKKFTTDLAPETLAPSTSLRPELRPELQPGPVVSETPPVSLNLPPASVDKPFVPQFPGDVPLNATKLRNPSSYLQSLIAGEPPVVDTEPQTQEEFLASLPGPDQVANASGGNNAFLDYIRGTNNDDNYVPQYPGDVPLSLSDPAAAAAIAEEKRLGIGGPDVIDSVGGIADPSEQGIISGLLQKLGGGVVSGTGETLLGASNIVESKNQTPRYIYGDSGIELLPGQVQDLSGGSFSDYLGPGLGMAFKGATALSNYFTGAEPPKTPVTAVGKVDYGFMPRGPDGQLLVDPNLPFVNQNEQNIISQGLDAVGQPISDLGQSIKDKVGGAVGRAGNRAVVERDADGNATGVDLPALGVAATESLGALAPALALSIAAKKPFAGALITGPQTSSDVGGNASARVIERLKETNPNASNAQIQAAVNKASDVTALPAAVLGVTDILPFLGKGLKGFLGGVASEVVSEGVAEQVLAASAASGKPTFDASLDEALVAGVTAGLGNVPTQVTNRTNAGTSSDGTSSSGGVASIPIVQPSGPAGTGLTAAQRSALSDVGGVNTAMTSSAAPTGIMTTAPVQSGGPAIDTVGRGQQTQEGQAYDAQFSTIPANPNVRVKNGLVNPDGTPFTREFPNETFTEMLARTELARENATAPATAPAAANVISGTQTAPQLLAAPTTDALPAFDISGVAQPNVTTNLDQITIPGTDVVVDVPKLAAPATDAPVNTQMPTGLSALGLGGTFNPNLAAGSTVSAPAITNTATEAVSQEQSIIDIIATEVAQEGGLSAATATKLAKDNNLSMVEVANLAETAMGLDTSKATGPSTSLVPVGRPKTGIATLDATGSDVGGLVGEIMTDTDVGAAKAPVDPKFDTIEGRRTGTGVATVVEVPAETTTAITDQTVTTPLITDQTVATEVRTPVKTPVGVVVLDDEDDDDDKGITVEVDEDVGDDDGGATIDLDPIDSDDDDGDGDELVPLEDDFECPDGYQKVMVKGQFVCQQIDSLPEKVRPTGGAYYQTNKNPEYGSRRRA